ncbi:MAG: A/G-specific adenine glycosylase [Pseudomonadota bacterium]
MSGLVGFAADLLGWYDRSARTLPWRVGPRERAAGASPDPYRVWLSEIMLQQTTVATVGPYFERFTARWPRVEDLAAAETDAVMSAWAGLGYYARARNMHACAKQVAAAHGGAFPDQEAALRALPGIGAYTAAAIAAIAFDRRAVVVDGNVERVTARLFRVAEPLPQAKPILTAHAERLTPEARPGDYAQAMMDLGATVCTPKRPFCAACPVSSHCAARAAGDAAEYPKKRPKAAKPVRLGVAYLALDGAGRALLVRRPDKGLLGGMLGLPGPEWSEAGPSEAAAAAAAPCTADWRALGVEARHTFTHFHLRLALRGARLARRPAIEGAVWAAPSEFGELALPTLMSKALKLGLSKLSAFK